MDVRTLLVVILPFIAGCAKEGRETPSPAAQPASVSAGLEVIERIDDYGYTERYQRRIADGVREGRYERVAPDGTIREEAFFLADTLHGARILFYPSGDTLSIEHYRHGAFQGPFRQYYENGTLQLAGQYAANEATGKWLQYYDNGVLMEIVTFAGNLENGPFVEYFPNGNLKAEGRYLDGDNEHGLLKLYDESGTLIRKMECERGVCQTVWNAEGRES